MRSHSVSIEGVAVLYPDKWDTFESHSYDTIKGSVFLADQDAVEFLQKLIRVTASKSGYGRSETHAGTHIEIAGLVC
jgi:hypothetical protein